MCASTYPRLGMGDRAPLRATFLAAGRRLTSALRNSSTLRGARNPSPAHSPLQSVVRDGKVLALENRVDLMVETNV